MRLINDYCFSVRQNNKNHEYNFYCWDFQGNFARSKKDSSRFGDRVESKDMIKMEVDHQNQSSIDMAINFFVLF